MTKDEGDCYQANGRLIFDIMCGDVKELKTGRQIMLCHGQVLGKTGAVKGVWFDHAWVEVADRIIVDHSNQKQIVVPKEALAHRIKQETVKRYTPAEASELILKHETWGPWEEST